MRVTEESIYHTLMTQGSKCINAECNSSDITFNLATDQGSLPSETARCSSCGCSWQVRVSYGVLTAVYDSTGMRVRLPHNSVRDRIPGHFFSLGGEHSVGLMYAARRVMESLKGQHTSLREKAEALAELAKFIPDELPPNPLRGKVLQEAVYGEETVSPEPVGDDELQAPVLQNLAP